MMNDGKPNQSYRFCFTITKKPLARTRVEIAPAQFAAIRTDSEFNDLRRLNPGVFYCKPADDYLPRYERY
ncbi:hypothetical protein O5478_18475 [Escherichia coli]|nr:hypothetical protein [Escherichia coli]